MSDTLPEESFFNIGVKAAILNSKGQLLVLHITHPDNVDTYWDLPGGRIADGETPEQTLRREIREETGITEFNIDSHLMMAMSNVQLPIFSTKKVGIVFSVYVCQSDSTVQQPEERIEMQWLPIQEAAARLRINHVWPEELIEKIDELGSSGHIAN